MILEFRLEYGLYLKVLLFKRNKALKAFRKSWLVKLYRNGFIIELKYPIQNKRSSSTTLLAILFGQYQLSDPQNVYLRKNIIQHRQNTVITVPNVLSALKNPFIIYLFLTIKFISILFTLYFRFQTTSPILPFLFFDSLLDTNSPFSSDFLFTELYIWSLLFSILFAFCRTIE